MISIAMLAHNEAPMIERTLASLFAQTIFQPGGTATTEVEFFVVANGCTDGTPEIARAALTALAERSAANHVSWRVEDLKRQGKCHAWNRYVHDFSSPRASHVFLMDADIELLGARTLESMVALLEQRPEVWVAVDQPVKDTELEPGGGLMRRFSGRIGELSGRRTEAGRPSWITGQLYCMRGDLIRQLWIPDEATVDDSLIYELVVTNFLREPAQPERVVLAADAAHRFEAYTTFAALLRHERFLIAAAIKQQLLVQDLRREMAERGGDAASIIARRDTVEPGWLTALVERGISARGWWLVPGAIVWRRFQALGAKAWHQLPLMVPLAMIAFVGDLVAAFCANRDLQRRRPAALSGKQ